MPAVAVQLKCTAGAHDIHFNAIEFVHKKIVYRD